MRVCEIEGCSEKHRAKGYCRKHYAEMRTAGLFGHAQCKAKGCNRIEHTKGYCGKHAAQIRRWGHVLPSFLRRKIQKKTRCNSNLFIQDNEITKIKLFNKNGKEIAETIIDTKDLFLVEGYNWYLCSTGYPKTKATKKQMGAHILDTPPGFQTDHKDGNKLNNRRTNLRIATSSQNNCNIKIRKTNKSGFKGVSWSKNMKKWCAQIGFNNKNIRLGFFNNPKKAAIVYDQAALQHHGEFALTNHMLGLL